MLDTRLKASLLQALSSACHLVLVGDVDQLPSVEPGDVLQDLIRSERFPVTRLDDIFRQGQGSNISKFGKRINSGDASLPKVVSEIEELDDDEDFQFLVGLDDEDCAEKVLRVHDKLVCAMIGSDPLLDTQILIPQYKGAVGINEINSKCQEKSSSELFNFRGNSFKIGDKVVCTKNDYDLDLRNGNIGIVKELNEKRMVVDFDGREVPFDAHDTEPLPGKARIGICA